MSKVIITKGTLDSEVISVLQQEKDNITNYINELDQELGAINEAWRGADATKYISKMKDDYSVLLNNLNECLQSYIDYLNNVYPQYENFDNEYTDRRIDF